jgi:hypothetical protein
MDIESNITKKSNLDIDDSLSSFRGRAAQQFHGAYNVFFEFIKDIKPKRILEIGTALGGFTHFLKWSCDELGVDCHILSYEVNPQPWYEEMKTFGIDVRLENIFGDNFSSVKQEVIDFIQQDGTTIVLCDGGYKIGEFGILSKYLKDGDFIMAHDYAENREIFQDKVYKKIWNWHEISNGDIMNACNENNLNIYQKDMFENVAWTCRRKEL